MIQKLLSRETFVHEKPEFKSEKIYLSTVKSPQIIVNTRIIVAQASSLLTQDSRPTPVSDDSAQTGNPFAAPDTFTTSQ